MSEPCSFFLKASIQKEQYLEFMQTKPSQPLVNDNWSKWWNSRQMHTHLDLARQIRAWDDASNQDIVNGWLAEEHTLTFSEFNEATSTWEFGIILCSDNYSEILPLLVFCESIFAHKISSPDDFAIIYPYFWGDSYVMAYITFSQEGMIFSLAESVTEVDNSHLDYAASRLGEKWKEFELSKKS